MHPHLKALLFLVALILVFAGPVLFIVVLMGWSPFGMLDWLYEWIQNYRQ
jgi:hypothetical protein